MENKNNSSEEPHDCCMKKDAGQKNELQKYLLVAMVAAVLVMSIVQSFQINSLKNIKMSSSQITTNSVSTTEAVDMSGWTEDEKMMYEHHGVLPSRLQ